MIHSLLRKYPSSLPVLFLVGMILVPFWELTTMRGYVLTDDVFTSDLMNEAFPYRFAMGEALKNGRLPAWLPHIYGGMPLLARADAGVCYPPNLLLFGLLPPYVALNLSILLTLVIAAVAMYFLARELDARTAASVIAGLAFAYSGFMIAHLKHLSMVGVACWFPAGLLAIERAIRRKSPRTFGWLSLVFALQILAGHVQIAYYSGLVYAAYFTFRLLSLRAGEPPQTTRPGAADAVGIEPAIRTRLLLAFVVAVALAVGIGAVQILPTYELVGLTQRAGGVTYGYAADYAYDLANFKTFFYANANGETRHDSYVGDGVFWEDYGYVGLVTILLAMLALFSRWRSWHVRFCWIGLVAAYLLVLGPHTPLYAWVFRLVPGMDYFRFPTRFLFVVDSFLCILAALGASKIRLGRKLASGTPGIDLLLIAAVAVDLLHFQLPQNPIVAAKDWRQPPKVVEMLKRDTEPFRVFSPGASQAHEAAFARAQGWAGSLQPYLDQREFLQPNSNVLYDIFSADGYAQLTPNHVVDVWGDQNRPGLVLATASLSPDGSFVPRKSFLNLMNMFNVKYVLSAWPIASEPFELVGKSLDAFVYRNPGALPRAFFVEEFRLASGVDAAKAILLSESFDPAREAVLFDEPALAFAGGAADASVAIERYAAGEVTVRVRSSSGGLLVLSDTFYPGWKSSVDGEEARILQANLNQRAVAVAAGSHLVRFWFESSTIRRGLVLTLASLFLAAGGLFASRQRLPNI